MKNMKKLTSILLALVMALGLMTTALAEGNEGDPSSEPASTPTATITAPDNGHTYEIYQIFTGDLDSTGKVLSNIKWGQNGTGTEGEAVDQSVLNALAAATGSDAEKLKVIEQYWNTDSNPIATISDGGENSATVPTGYYLFKDTTDESDLADGESHSVNVVQLVGSITITDKVNKTQLDKEVGDGTPAGWTDATDYNIGDSIPFKLTATLGANVTVFETYEVVFTDTMSEGLTYNQDAKVYIDGNEKTGDFTISNNTTDAGTVLTITCADVLALGASDNSVITVEYSATLNEKAEIGGSGNSNKAYLEYSDTDGTGKTPEKENLVFTYELDTTKVDGSDKTTGLKDAEFKLHNADNKWVTVSSDGKVTGWVDDEESASVLTSDDDGLFNVIGLDAGTYYLKETKAPDGYNLLTKEVEIVIKATVSAADREVTQLDVTADGESGTSNKGEGTVGVTIANNKGTELPETGGIGTTIFYAVGGVLVVAAVVLLVTKKRMGAKD